MSGIVPSPARAVEPLLIDLDEASRLTAISVRHLRRMARQELEHVAVRVGKRLLFSLPRLREWVAGLSAGK
jgi:hypothetical protein